MEYEVDTYNLEYVENEDKYYISFKDSVGNNCRIEIEKEIFDVYMTSRKAYTKIKNETSRYLEHSELTDISLYNRSFEKLKNVEEFIVGKVTDEELYKIIKSIREPHNKRLEMYVFNNMTVEEIALKEDKTIRAIRYSLEEGKKEILKKLKNF